LLFYLLKVYSLEVVVTPGVYGLYLNFPSAVAAGSQFLIQTYLMQGDYVTFTWIMDGVSISRARTGKYLFKICYILGLREYNKWKKTVCLEN
jgi:hypothetical protein